MGCIITVISDMALNTDTLTINDTWLFDTLLAICQPSLHRRLDFSTLSVTSSSISQPIQGGMFDIRIV